MKIECEPAPLENAGHSQIARKQNEEEKQSVEVYTEGLTLGNVKPMDPPIYSPPSEFNDTILSENIRRADHEEKTVKIGRKPEDTGAYPAHTRFSALWQWQAHEPRTHTLAENSEAAEREKS